MIELPELKRALWEVVKATEQASKWLAEEVIEATHDAGLIDAKTFTKGTGRYDAYLSLLNDLEGNVFEHLDELRGKILAAHLVTSKGGGQ